MEAANRAMAFCSGSASSLLATIDISSLAVPSNGSVTDASLTSCADIVSSVSVSAASAWVARGDLAARRGDHEKAAELYRTAAEALQDVRF